jgi:hypothetical protein
VTVDRGVTVAVDVDVGVDVVVDAKRGSPDPDLHP